MNAVDIFFNGDILLKSFPILLRGLGNTLMLAVVAIFCGTVGGVFVSLARLYAPKPVRLLAVFYIDILRSMPMLVVLILIYYALPFVGITLSSFGAAAFALSIVMAAYTAECVRAGIEAVPRGQFEAADALGLSFWRTMQKVILPQAIKLVIPPMASNSVSLVKDTSLASVVAMNDLLKQATDAQALFANPTPLIGAAIIYVAILWPAVRVTNRLERRFAKQDAR